MTSVVCWRRTKSQAAQRTKRRQLKSLLRLAAVGVMIKTTTKLCMTVHRGQRLWLCDAAYEALIDPEKRQIYDRHGEEGLKQHDAQGGGGGGPQDIFSQCVPFRYLDILHAHCLSVSAAQVHSDVCSADPSILLGVSVLMSSDE